MRLISKQPYYGGHRFLESALSVVVWQKATFATFSLMAIRMLSLCLLTVSTRSRVMLHLGCGKSTACLTRKGPMHALFGDHQKILEKWFSYQVAFFKWVPTHNLRNPSSCLRAQSKSNRFTWTDAP